MKLNSCSAFYSCYNNNNNKIIIIIIIIIEVNNIIQFVFVSLSRFYIPLRIFKLSVWQFVRSISLPDINLT